MLHRLVLSTALAFLLGCSGGSPVESGGGALSGLCSASNPCPSGQFCFNGLCAVGCQSNKDCSSTEYCDTSKYGDRLCHEKQVTTCPATPCASGQSCTAGLCGTPATPVTTGSGGGGGGTAQACNPDGVWSGNDGCEKTALCFGENDKASCSQFPACGEDGSCPVGAQGALCNDGLIQNKGRICLPSLCKRTQSGSDRSPNCPSNWACVQPIANTELGVCSSGSNLAPCNSNAHCSTGRCVKGAPSDVMGMCSDGKTGSPCSVGQDCTSGNCGGIPGFTGACL